MAPEPGRRKAPSSSRLAERPPPGPDPRRLAQAAEESEEWVISYMDMVTLLMIVFLGMVAILGMDGRLAVAEGEPAPRTEEAAPPAGEVPVPTGPAPTLAPDAAAEKPLSPAARAWLDRLEAAGLPPDVDLAVAERRVTLVVRSPILFASGSAVLQPGARDLLAVLAPAVAAVPGSITVEGHTDDVVIRNGRYPSNWELSAARAATVVRALVELGVPPARLAAKGLADSRPVTPDPTRRAENRRVEIVIDTDPASADAAVR